MHGIAIKYELENDSNHTHNLLSFFFLIISKGNFIQELNNESPKYTESIDRHNQIHKLQASIKS